jgi:Fic family protein
MMGDMTNLPDGQGVEVRRGNPLDVASLYARLSALDADYVPMERSDAWSGLVVDAVQWDHLLQTMQATRERSTTQDHRRAIEVAMRAAAVDTGAIEGLYEVDRGLTLSVATQATAWQASVMEKGQTVRELFEAQLQAYELALDVATRSVPITEAWIRRLHEVLCAPEQRINVLTSQGWQEQPLLKGEYKRTPNHVLQPDGSWFAYAPVMDTPAEMHRLVEELSHPGFLAEHPVVQTSYAHHAFVRIHPFQDGNGRVARALASVFLYRAATVPLVIFADEKSEYLAALRAADRGERQVLVGFIAERVAGAVQLVAEQAGGDLEQRVTELRSLLSTRSGLAHAEIDVLARRLVNAAHAAAELEIRGLALPAGARLYSQANDPTSEAHRPPPPGGYRPISSPHQAGAGVYLWGEVESPAQAHAQRAIRVYARVDGEAEGLFRLVAGGGQGLDINLGDVQPDIRTSFDLRLRAWVRRVLESVVDEMASQAREALKSAGYQSNDDPTSGG